MINPPHLTAHYFLGCLFAGICSIQMLCSTVGSVLFNAVYMATVTTFAGFVFIIMAILFVICIICMR